MVNKWVNKLVKTVKKIGGKIGEKNQWKKMIQEKRLKKLVDKSVES